MTSLPFVNGYFINSALCKVFFISNEIKKEVVLKIKIISNCERMMKKLDFECYNSLSKNVEYFINRKIYMIQIFRSKV